MQVAQDQKKTWLDHPLVTNLTIDWETVLFVAIILLAVITRFYHLGDRVMSHDESLHTYYSWKLYRGEGFQHTPMMHGVWQFIMIALSYFMFGDSDFTARLPAVLTSIATIVFIWKYRRYLGRAGTLVASALLVISPFMLYYGRYVRNEAYVGLFGVITFWAMLRYLEKGEAKYLYALAAATVLHFTAKETAFIYTAQALLFLGLLFIQQVTQRRWKRPELKRVFIYLLIAAFVLLALTGGAIFMTRNAGALSATETAAPANPTQVLPESNVGLRLGLPAFFIAGSLISLATALYFLISGYSLQRLRQERSFDMIILLGTLVLPQLAPFPVRMMGWDALDYSTTGMIRTAIFLIPLGLASIGIGLWWKPRLWLTSAAIFYGIFTVYYTTIFTNGQGFFTGIVGSLGYWLKQQGVARGSQPWYYYLLIQIPVYEYLPALGSVVALWIAAKKWLQRRSAEKVRQKQKPGLQAKGTSTTGEYQLDIQGIAVAFLTFWTITSLLAYTIAGEKMPWLTYHIALPMILLTGWGLGKIIEESSWAEFKRKHGWPVIALLVVFLPSVLGVFEALLGTTPPFQGKELAELQATSNFLIAFLAMVLSGWGLYKLFKPWKLSEIERTMVLSAFALLALLTIRTAFRASYINYDNATEYLVYAHSAGPVKEIMRQVEEISRRTDGDLTMPVGYDDAIAWPFTWYLRNYTNQKFYGANPTRDLREAPVILVGATNFGKVEPITGQAYYRFDYIRMWWPNQDYFNLTWDRIKNALTNPEMRAAIFDIWLNRDYSKYAEVTGQDMSLANWSPSDRMRLYIRKDIANQIWDFGIAATPEEVVADPYEGKELALSPDKVIGQPGSEAGQFNHPRGMTVAPDGSLYVADANNHRIQHLAADGSVLQVWGSFGDILQSPDLPGGFFNQPWGVAVGPDGSVYVADTWNHRIQKFTADGQFLTMWGFFGQAETPDAFWGPRSVVVSPEGQVYVADTGNKRVVVFDEAGNYLTQFGTEGFSPGQFYEPVGLALDAEGRVYIADTWNQRIQIMEPDPTNPAVYLPAVTWDVVGWYGQSLDNKPYLAVDDKGHVFATDPEGYRVLEFDQSGNFIQFWGDYSTGPDGFGLAAGIAVDPAGGVWVSDAGNGLLLHFTLP